MSQMIAYCGLDCAACPAYIATQKNDVAELEKVVAQWQAEYNAPNMTIKDATCDGCTANARLGGYCSQCTIRACASGKGIENCAHCEYYTACEDLETFFKQAPPAKANLEAIRQLM